MTHEIFNPFEGAPDEVPLNNAPLVQTLCQVRFPPIMKVSETQFIANFQEAIRLHYPVVQQETSQVMTMTGAAAKLEIQPVWRFFDSSRQWRVSLTPNFLSVETKVYKSRDDFLEKVAFILEQVHKTINPSHATRVGLRYINHLEYDFDATPSNLLKDDLCITFGSIKHSPKSYMMSEVFFESEHGSIQSKWGFLPQFATHDVENMQPKAGPSTFLDIDAFIDIPDMTLAFEPGAIVEKARILSAACYNFFRWRVNDKLIESNRILS